MKLYYAPWSCSMSAHIALREAGLPHEIERVDNATKKTEKGADYLRINPKGYLPALMLDNGEVLTEAAVILQYIADRNPASGLAPANGTMERYRLQEWLNFIATELHTGFRPFWKGDTHESYLNFAKEKLAQRYDFLEKHLATNEYLLGNAFTVADAYCFVVTNWAKTLKYDMSKWPAVQAYVRRISLRPAVQETIKAEA